MITHKEIIDGLKNFEFQKGKPVIVHTSLKAIGKIEGGAETLLSALIEVFTENDGLLCVPTHTWKSMVLNLNAAAQFCSAVKMKNVMELIYKNADGRELLADSLPLDEALYKF